RRLSAPRHRIRRRRTQAPLGWRRAGLGRSAAERAWSGAVPDPPALERPILDASRLFAGLLLPWLVGGAAMLVLFRRPPSECVAGEFAWNVGSAYFVGAFLLTLWMRALSIAGIRLGVMPVALPLLLFAAAATWFAGRREGANLLRSARAALRALVSPPGVEG